MARFECIRKTLRHEGESGFKYTNDLIVDALNELPLRQRLVHMDTRHSHEGLGENRRDVLIVDMFVENLR